MRSKPQEISNGTKKIQCRYTLYVLKLQGGRYYVGKAQPSRLTERIKEHRDIQGDRGSAWTKLYPVVQECTSMYQYQKSPFDEDRKVKQMMYIYGVDMVRGGTYSQTANLSPELANFILRQFQGATDLCYKCNKSGHFIRKCPNLNKKIELENIQKQNKAHLQRLGNNRNEKKEVIEQKLKIAKHYWYLPKCSKCSEYGHYTNDCKYMPSSIFEVRYKRYVKCYNCGKLGHKSQDCWQSDYESDFGSDSDDDDHDSDDVHGSDDDDHSEDDDDDEDDEDDDDDDDDDDQDDSDDNGRSKQRYYRSRNKNSSQRNNSYHIISYSASRSSNRRSSGGCFNCGDEDHWARDCPKKKRY